MKVLPISSWSPSTQNAMSSTPIRGDVGNYSFEAGGGGGGGGGGGEDSLFTNVELAVGVVSSIIWDLDLKKVEALCIEEALALSLQGTVSVCLSAFFYPSRRCVNVIC